MANSAIIPRLKTPGVYIEEIRLFPPSVAQVETAIPAFIGYTEKAEKDGQDITKVPTRISSLLEYVEFFGSAQPEQNIVVKESKVGSKTVYNAEFGAAGRSRHIMYYAMQQYFANGGGPCYIVSAGGYLDFGTVLSDQTGLTASLKELEKFDEPTLIVFPEGQNMDQSTYFALVTAALQQCNKLGDRFTIIDFHKSGKELNTAGDVLTAATEFRSAISAGPDFLKYGAAYFPNVSSTYNYIYNEATVSVISGATTKTFADLNNAEKSSVKLAIDNFSISLPPSASMAGIYARVDNTRGVWKAPANEGVFAVDNLAFKVNDEVQDFLNIDVNDGKSINAIRHFAGKGTIVWGGRTLLGNDNEWRYISVRRFFNMVEESTKKATAQFVFEPNNRNTWVKVRAMIENFLTIQWNAGALAGAVPEDAFYVSVGLGETMTALDILEGRMIVEIGMAVVRPAEFIILQYMHKMQES